MRLITWNIQCGKACDGLTNLARIVAVAKEMADADVFCFQEVSCNFSSLGDGAELSLDPGPLHLRILRRCEV